MIQVDQHGSVTTIRMARSFLGKPLYWVAAYWLDGLLIDTGPACTAPQLVRVLQKTPVEQIVITHAHEDHFGGLAALRKRYPQAAVYASPRTIPIIEAPEQLKLQLYRRLLWGTPQAVDGLQSLDQIDNSIQTRHHKLRVIETPGHTLDHVSYFEPAQRWLFSGDAFIGGYERTWPAGADLFAVMGTLRTLDSLQPERLFPGSGNVRTGNTRHSLRAEINDKINYLTWLAGEIQKLDRNKTPLKEMIVHLFKKEPMLTRWTHGHLSAQNLIDACRRYNALFAPLSRAEQAQFATIAPGKASATSGTSSSASADRSSTDEESADLSDWNF